MLPATVYHLIWRSFRQGDYLLRWNERYAMYGNRPVPGATVWVHAVSVGEVSAAAPLVNALRARRPDLRLLVTSITPTGSARIRALWGDQVEHVYLPYDLPGAVARFLRHFRPQVGLVLETELWPNLLFGCRDHDVPVWIVNARLSERSLRGYRLLRPWLSRALRTVRGVLAQSPADAARFVRLGADPATTRDVGNLKYDIATGAKEAKLVAECRRRLGGRRAWIAASTHPGEEAEVIAMHRRLRTRWPDLLLLWAPRHPERFRAASLHAVEAGWRVATRRLTRWPDAADDVFVIDTLGELSAFYGCAQVAFVGGSLEDIGGHNLLEPAAAGTPVVSGPFLRNFADIAARMQAAGALRVGADAEAVAAELEALLASPMQRDAMVAAGLALVEEGRGALERTLALLAADLPRRG
jgi:3-deoxy-D-manno-octulosonic-acid transferase